MSEHLEIVPLTKPPCAAVRVPGSKSITNRALVLAALTAKGFGYALRGVLRSEDTEVMVDSLRALGFRVLTEWPESTVLVSSGEEEPTIPAREADLFVANSGTSMRFLTALVSLGHGRYRLDGVPRMRERPIEDLLDALRQLGVDARSENNNGCPPVVIKSDGLIGGAVCDRCNVRIRGSISSQFLSGLLMAAPFAQGWVSLIVDGPLVSRPYVEMTLRMLHSWDLPVSESWGNEEATFRFFGHAEASCSGHAADYKRALVFREGFDPRRQNWACEYLIEPDASAASYFFGAAAIAGGRVTVPDIPLMSLQGDVRFVEVLEEMGCTVVRDKTGITIHGGPLRGIDADMNDISDTVMTLAAVACFAEGPTTIRNVSHIRHKETDRLAALAAELRRVGAEVTEFADGLTITPRPLHGAEIETYNDHRMAMSMALIGLRVPGIVIKNPGCVAKTYPHFFTDLERLRQGPREDKS
ncbi:MAG TPA: 3-phosphoshikimate 1-carboxyvinyltransferase [Gemmataceae bacterium]|nr:3-phosphoshikimate 1-carboxyvinyltransferase [Gemmataceae bacterium]